ncbi:Cysteine-rich with EGF-like domain protein 2 [Desmophyllum pertusum]|uniref:Cysteine-rich with EGF-like domain protein 2 n=1 Tax=Desmophyllum pertusum TaxID=174260 RepID=A0A9X0CXA4_9CNID|nr:Cysteine-rich with EGF-like domain protein 2 [Desmophyllum pertusum]
MEISLKMSKNWIVQIILVVNILIFCGLRSAAREKKAKCPTCKDIVEAFKKGKDNTEKSNFGGGNTAWEERKLGSYANSETRLVEILDGLCDESASECHAMVEDQEEALEEWWFDHQFKSNDMKTWFCIDKLKVCCPDGTYGKDCTECSGGKENPCNGHGECKGDGTREGTGKCSCDSGYEGDLCDECADLYFEEQDEDSKTKCTACHESCADGCSGSSEKDCEKCKEGWDMTDEDGCKDKNECDEEDKCEGGKYCVNNPGSYKCEACDDSCEGNCTGEGLKDVLNVPAVMSRMRKRDVDECAENSTICENGKFCDNTPGSHVCRACHSACETCIGEGSQGCMKCNTGYKMAENECKDEDECSSGDHQCDPDSETCRNMPGSFTCDCRKGFRRDGDKCIKKKGKKTAQKDTKKTEEQALEDDLTKGNYYSQLQMKLGSVLYAVFFACVVAAVLKRSRLAIVVLTLVYACILWCLRR